MNQKKEMIGRVTLDLEFYPGEDYYCDGEIEDELLEIVKTHSPKEFQSIIEQEANWPVLYHLSELRANIMDWFPITKDSKVLEIGSGCGAITGCLSEKAGSLTCIDLSKKRSLINAYRNREKDNICIKVGNFQDIEPSLGTDYDLICLIGVFEYAKGYIGTKSPYTDFLSRILKHCKKGGQVVIAIENRLGMKYFAGCREDHLGDFHSGIEDYPDGGVVRTFSRPALEKILKECGVSEYAFYYPYPDYKFANTIYSDDRLPKVGELTNNLRNFDRSRLMMFDEKNAFDSVIRDGEFPLFSNSYFVVIGPKPEIIYSKFSNDREKRFALRTDILRADKKVNAVNTKNGCPKADTKERRKEEPGKDGKSNMEQDEGSRIVRKVPCSDDADSKTMRKVPCSDDTDSKIVRKVPCSKDAGEHMKRIASAAEKLTKRYEGSGLEICPCTASEGVLWFPYLEGVTLEEKLDQCLETQDMESFSALLRTYCNFVRYNEACEVADFDLIFSNILIDEDKKWQVIDYEWTYEKKIPAKEIMKRALYCYRLGSEKRRQIDMQSLCEEFQLGEWDENEISQKELEFQKSVTGNQKSMSEMRDLIGNEILSVTAAITQQEQKKQKQRVQIYYDRGRGFSEADSEFMIPVSESEFRKGYVNEAKSRMGGRSMAGLSEETDFVIRIAVKEDIKRLRVDPAMESCIVTLKSLLLKSDNRESLGNLENSGEIHKSDNNKELELKKEITFGKLKNSGVQVGKNTYLFSGVDPNFILPTVKGKEGDVLELHYSLVRLPQEMAGNCTGGWKKLFC